jgi:peptidoglycan/LPS O-acetylase OafA/YrhL
LAVTVTAIGPFNSHVFGPYLWRYYGLSQIYSSQTLFSGLPVAWSLSVELSFYLVLPLLAWSAARRVVGRRGAGATRVQLGLIAAATLGSLALRAALAGSPSTPTQGALSMVALPGMLDWFAIGMALAVVRALLETGGTSVRVIDALARRPSRCLLLAVAVFAAAVPSQQGDTFLPWYGFITHVALGVGAGLLVLSVIGPHSAGTRPRRRILCHPLLAWLGTISYGIYLWNLLVGELITPHLLPVGRSGGLDDAVLLWVIVVAGAGVCGAASWYLVERPVQRFFGSRQGQKQPRRTPGHMAEIDGAVQSTLDPLNSPGVAVDHLA